MTAPSFTYTLIGYRADGVDTCRGCVMGRSESDFFVKVFFTPEEVAQEWAHRLFEEEKLGREYCSVDYTLLLDGRDDNNDPESWGVDELCNPSTGEGWAEEARSWVAARVAEVVTQLKESHLAAEERALNAKKLQDLKIKAQQHQVTLEAERAEHRRLQAKFGNNET